MHKLYGWNKENEMINRGYKRDIRIIGSRKIDNCTVRINVLSSFTAAKIYWQLQGFTHI